MNNKKMIIAVLFTVYVLAVLYITLFAWNYGASLGPTGPGGRNYNVIPFRSIYRISVFSTKIIDPLRILVGNIILFVPLGFIIPLLGKAKRIVHIVMIGFLFSLSIEIAQFLFTYRVADVDDLILNTFGSFCGAILFIIYVKIKRRVIFFHLK